MSELLSLFPLPNVVLFPNVCLPLHIFEPRYREMVANTLDGDRIIGMVLLRPGWEGEYEGRPAIYQVGCAGLITHAERTEDGRYNLVLRGLERFRILAENHDRSYRRAAIEPLHERALSVDDRTAVRRCREKLETMLSPAVLGDPRDLRGGTARAKAADAKIPTAMSDEDLINALAQYLDLEPLEKQALLEQPSLMTRATSLVELLEMKIMVARTPGVSTVTH